MTHAIVIAGPTASGKSGLALAVAQAFGGWVINADSMQVYDVLRILTARPSPSDAAAAPHHLYGVLNPADICSAARWRDMAAATMEQARNAQALPIIVGGTGLYLRALMEGLSPIPEIPAAIRDEARALLAQWGNQTFHQRLCQRDPEMAGRLDAGNSQRLCRAWEVIEATGQSLAQWQRQPNQGAVAAQWLTLVLDPPRPTQQAACAARFHQMIAQGALDEARAMAALNLPPECPSLRALGLPDLMAHLQGHISLEQACDQGIHATRAYAKRQGTWFRHQIKDAHQIKTQFSESLLSEIFSIIRQFLLTPALIRR